MIDKELVSSISWGPQLISASDKLSVWNSDGEFLQHLDIVKETIIDIAWFPTLPKGASSDVFALASSDGKVFLASKRLEKTMDAHTGACLNVKWNYDGTALASAGQDGLLKIWSKGGMLRSQLLNTNYPIYSISWSPNGDAILLTNGRNLIIKSLTPSVKPTQWKAHEELVLCVDWNLVNNLIVSGSEDGKYKIWDSFGRQIYSFTQEYPITSIKWNPTGEVFAVGTFNELKICDKLGWTYSIEKPECGSVLCLSWSPDGTQFIGGTSSGQVLFAHLSARRLEYKHLQLVVNERSINVQDVNGPKEDLEFRDLILRASIGHSHLVVATLSQCYVYSEKNWNTPAVIDFKGRITCIVQCPDAFCLVDTNNGLSVYSYEGRLLSSPKYPGIRPEFMTNHNISISSDTLAIKDHANEKTIYLFETTTGKPTGTIVHTQDIVEIALSQSSSPVGRLLAVVDKQNDFFLTRVLKPEFRKIGTMVESFAWNDDADILLTMMDGKMNCYYYPFTCFVDEGIASLTCSEKPGLGKNTRIFSFTNTNSSIRKEDGSIINHTHSVYPFMLHEFSKKKQWEQAIRLCRHAQHKELWATLAAMSVYGQDLNTAEVAYAAIGDASKVQFITQIRDLPNDLKAAQLALLRRAPKEAESIYLSGNYTYRAIRMWIDLFEWEKALELAQKYKVHVDTVAFYRSKYIKALGHHETNKRFSSLSIQIDAKAIQDRISKEK